MTLNKFNKLYSHYKTYHDLDMKKLTFEAIEQSQIEDEEWL